MREIKFRAKERSGEWHVGSLFVEDGMGIPYIVSGVNTHYETNYLTVEVVSETVGQFTGLKDPTGKEIYEGDILECLALDDGPFVVRVVFRNGAFHTDVHDGVNGADFTCLLADLFSLGEVRIVGNIWDGYPKFVSIEGIGGFEK